MYLCFSTLSWFRSNLIHTQAKLLLDYMHLFTISSFSANQNCLDIWNKAFCFLSQLTWRATLFRSKQANKWKKEKKKQNIFLERECSTLEKNMTYFFIHKISYLEIQKTTQGGQSNIRLGGMKAQTVKWQIRMRFGRTVVKWFSICYYKKILQCTHKTLVNRLGSMGFQTLKRKQEINNRNLH